MLCNICALILMLTSVCVVLFSKRKDSIQLGMLIMIIVWLMLIYEKIN